MIADSDLPGQVSKQLMHILRNIDSDAQIKVKLTSLGWLYLDSLQTTLTNRH